MRSLRIAMAMPNYKNGQSDRINLNQLLGENKPYSLNSTYNVCALKNLQFGLFSLNNLF